MGKHVILARLICLLLDHSFDSISVLESVQPRVYVNRGRCARCKTRIIEVVDLRSSEEVAGENPQ